jgi:hypothetical protein
MNYSPQKAFCFLANGRFCIASCYGQQSILETAGPALESVLDHAIMNEFRRHDLVDYGEGRILVFPDRLENYLRKSAY